MVENTYDDIVEAAACSQASYIHILGGGSTGKSLALARRAKHLLDEGTPANDILVFSATPSAADAMRDSLDRLGVKQVRVTTLAEFAREVLSTPEVEALTGRNPRLLCDFEERILMEDMKVVGLKSRRLAEMLKYFYKQWTVLGDEREGFIQGSEEDGVYATLCENLRLRGAMLRQELSNVAVKFYRDHADAADAFRVPHVLADDVQNLNRASQELLELIATKSLAVAGNVNAQVPTTEPYPDAGHFSDFGMRHFEDGCEAYVLPQALNVPACTTSMANALVVNGGLDTATLAALPADTEGDVHFVEWTHPNDEFLGIARYIKHRLADVGHPVHPHDIFVAVPNAIWGRALAKVLNANDIKTDQVVSYNALTGDPRKLDRSVALQAYTRLGLAADPTDAVAWRSWFGFGDYLTNSNHWFRLERYAQEQGLGVLEALDRLAGQEKPEVEGIEVLLRRYADGKAFVGHARGKQGFALLNMCAPVRGEKLPAEFMALLEPVEGMESAEQLLAKANSRLENRFTDLDAVRIGLPQMACGMSFDTVILMGCVEGFYPAAKALGVEFDDERRAEMQRAERRLWYAAMTKARYGFVASTIQKDEANTAASLGMHAHRIRMEDGRSMAILSPSCYLAEMGDAAPGFQSRI
ncbi:ATP-dependent DNA helicase PcrA [Slackia heliotrinireducens]|uniref:DNA/RNA helicase, superfamily I n=1 Tax=Slackia heliotrinireducens (strain ATCC 29202 / DSM 20476 / NCTC 11029 / RHS 1) TaxID=471855 RepID=C7N3S9_SLAHD|nr:UvrD-helicase domain-containing protein [Slackia heliotrinireducens]ACV21670.1 DNA/RNA helicase, superfamily I [Slackia heliotrinireducens DSM 20476]VEG99281.1 ATP-dependent DNA helicase PcrA [Slackia heliotrinireducens]